jgi:hypothetical protein
MAQASTGGAGCGDRGEQPIADGDDRRGGDGRLELLSAELAPLGDDRAERSSATVTTARKS